MAYYVRIRDDVLHHTPLLLLLIGLYLSIVTDKSVKLAQFAEAIYISNNERADPNDLSTRFRFVKVE